MRKIRKDFEAKGVAQSDHQIGRVMTELMAEGDRRHQGRQITSSAGAQDRA